MFGANHCVNEVEEGGKEAESEKSLLSTRFSLTRAFHFPDGAVFISRVFLWILSSIFDRKGRQCILNNVQ